MKYLFYKFIKAYKLPTQKSKSLHSIIRAYLMLSKVKERRSDYKYLELEKLLSTSTEVIGRRKRTLTDVLIFASFFFYNNLFIY
jgi:hypothetical protein